MMSASYLKRVVDLDFFNYTIEFFSFKLLLGFCSVDFGPRAWWDHTCVHGGRIS